MNNNFYNNVKIFDRITCFLHLNLCTCVHTLHFTGTWSVSDEFTLLLHQLPFEVPCTLINIFFPRWVSKLL